MAGLRCLLDNTVLDNNGKPILGIYVLANISVIGVTYTYRYTERLVAVLDISYRLDTSDYTYDDLEEYFDQDITFRDVLQFFSNFSDNMTRYTIDMVSTITKNRVVHCEETFIEEGEDVEVIDAYIIDNFQKVLENTKDFEVLAGDLITGMGIEPVLPIDYEYAS